MRKFQEVQISLPLLGTISIREAQIDEVNQLTEFLVATIRTSDSVPVLPEEIKGSPQDDEQWLSSYKKNENLMLVAIFANKIIANSDITVSSLQMLAHTGLISVNVSEQFRGHGLGRKLLETMIGWVISDSKIESLWLNVLSKNEVAIGLYGSLGFQEVGRQPRFVKTLKGIYYDNIIMNKFLE